MKISFWIFVLLPFLTSCKHNEVVDYKKDMSHTSTYYLIRHAEKDRTDPNNEDPNLNVDGLKRAQRWASYFDALTIDQIYVTKFIRTKQTVSMVAQQKAVTPTLYDPHNIPFDAFLETTRGKNVLIVGHNNTIPKLVNALITKDKFGDMDENDNATLYKVVIDGNDKKVEAITVE